MKGGDDMIEIINMRPIKEVRHFNSIYVKDFDIHRREYKND